MTLELNETIQVVNETIKRIEGYEKEYEKDRKYCINLLNLTKDEIIRKLKDIYYEKKYRKLEEDNKNKFNIIHEVLRRR